MDLLLPPDVWIEILTRVSLKTVLRCRSVCKSLCSLISCPDFNSEYSIKNLNKNGNRVVLCLLHHKNVVWSYSSIDESSMESRKHDEIPEAFLDSSPQFVGSCNGLICFSGYGYDNFLVWNPTIRKIVEIPSPTLGSGTRILSFCGFGFDSKTNDYKVMCAARYVNNGNYFNVCEIFDMRKGVWRVICPRMPSKRRYRYVPECYLDGAVHWSDRRDLLSFNLSDECFREIKMPNYENLIENNRLPPDIITKSVTSNGLIYVIIWTGLEEDCSIWAMKEYGVAESWTRVFDINLKGFQNADTIWVSPKSFCLWKNGEVLMVHACRRWSYEGGSMQDLVSYNLENKKFKNIFSIVNGRILCFEIYEESLALV